MATITITPASGSITAKQTVCRIDISGAEDNRPPTDTGGAFAYYLLIDAPSGTDDGKSYAFNVSAAGGHTFNNYIFPIDGSYTLRLRDASNDSDVATAAVTVA
jgi:hypothetical protein